MSAGFVLDASAALAYVKREPGGDYVRSLLGRAVISAVNLAEVVGRIERQGDDGQRLARKLIGLGVVVEPFTREDAFEVGAMEPASRPQGLSLADRACIVLAKRTGGVLLTADQAMAANASGSVPVEMIRWPSAPR